MNDSKYYVDECIFMLDCARKYLTPGWIKKLIGEIADVGYNGLILHFSEDMGLRIESKRYPWLAGGDHRLCPFGIANGEPENNGKYITQDEMADIVRYAQSRGVEIIPSLDSPGHMNYAVKTYNEHFGVNISNYFHKDGKVSIVQGSSALGEQTPKSFSRGIDLANPEAVAFAKSLYEEYGSFFASLGCKRFVLGSDEILGFGETIDDSLSKWQNLEHWDKLARELTGSDDAVAYDAFILYANDICRMLKEMGYESIFMWNDDVYRSFDTGWQGITELDKTVEILYWSDIANNGENTVRAYIDRGHTVYNLVERYAYYTLYPDRPTSKATPEEILTTWNPYVFGVKSAENTVEAPNPLVKGAGICLWTDTPARMTEDEILEGIRPYFTAIAKKSRGIVK